MIPQSQAPGNEAKRNRVTLEVDVNHRYGSLLGASSVVLVQAPRSRDKIGPLSVCGAI